MNHDETALIARHIEPDPYHPGPGDVRLVDSGVAVWAIVGHLMTVRGDADRVAEDYELSPEAVAAALAYYREHKGAIDARLAANAGSAAEPSRVSVPG